MTAMVASTLDIDRGAEVLVSDYMNVQPGDLVVITADSGSDMAGVQAVFSAVARANAKPSIVIVPQMPFQGRLADPYITPAVAGAVMACDVWIDLTFPYMAGSKLYDDAMLGKHIRYLLGGDMTGAGMARLFGKVDFDVYYETHRTWDELMAQSEGREVRITDDLGSDVRFKLGKPAYTKPRRAVEPGMYTVPGACTMFPEIESVQGVVHVGSIYHEYYTSLRAPLTIQVDGKIQKVSGGGNERLVADRALRRAGGGDYGYIIHFTHGIHPAARVTGESFIEDMRVMGNDAVGLGLPWWVEGGGENHPDAVLYLQSATLDNQPFIQDGLLVGPDHLAKQAEKLAPLYI